VHTSSSSGADSDGNDYHATKLMESKNPYVRLMIFGKIKRMIYSLKGIKLKPHK
jgi:hypothetical protein